MKPDTARKTPPVNAELTAIAHRESEIIGGEPVETVVTDWSGTAPAFVRVETRFSATIEGEAITSDDVTTVVIPSDLVEAEAPDFGLGYLLRVVQRGRCQTVRVTGLETKPDYGFVRCVTDGELLDPAHELCT